MHKTKEPGKNKFCCLLDRYVSGVASWWGHIKVKAAVLTWAKFDQPDLPQSEK